MVGEMSGGEASGGEASDREASDRYVPAAGRRVFTPLYDAVNAVAMRQGQWRPRLVERALGTGAAPRILDLGCGTGEMALPARWRWRLPTPVRA
jgi:ubiquinone/menaquinone biosynthesis C-methylase UbiE